MQAWKDKDGRYTLIDEGLSSHETYQVRAKIKALGGRWYPGLRHWTVPAEALDILKADRVYGVVCAPSCCEPAMFRYVSAREVEVGRVDLTLCSRCDSRSYQATIIDVCGEPDGARAVYEAEFKAKIEG